MYYATFVLCRINKLPTHCPCKLLSKLSLLHFEIGNKSKRSFFLFHAISLLFEQDQSNSDLLDSVFLKTNLLFCPYL